MPIIHNGIAINDTEDILLNKWKLKSVTGDEKPDKPSLCIFNNTAYAVDLLHKHLEANSRIVFHTDVDVDGVGTTYIIKKALEKLSKSPHILMINKEKVHGIQQKHVDFFNSRDCADLIIITDSSSNEIDTIKQFNCDVLCIDHHDLINKDLIGTCNDGVHRYVIVNNTIDNTNQNLDIEYLSKFNKKAFENTEPYLGTSAMSCGLVVYELLRVYCLCFYDEKLLENLMLYQWVGITLFTDVIDTLNNRNQWYIDKTIFSMETEEAIKLIISSIENYRLAKSGKTTSAWIKTNIDKSYIQYSIAPLINKAIRAGAGSEVVSSVINNPLEISGLHKYDGIQDEMIKRALKIQTVDPDTGDKHELDRAFTDDYVILNSDEIGTLPNYNGVIASRIAGDNKKNTAVYKILDNGICKGSFRGRYKNVKYRSYFAEYDSNIYAQGHEPAFGFELTKEQLDNIMSNINNIEPEDANKPYITAGNMPESDYGEYHITNIDEFKKQGYIWRLATGNSKVISTDEIYIRVRSNDISLKKNYNNKLYVYDVMGIECKAFEPMIGNYFDIYFEFSKEVNAFIRKA